MRSDGRAPRRQGRPESRRLAHGSGDDADGIGAVNVLASGQAVSASVLEEGA
ncbi:MAG: hypothetical protein LBR80_12895 [Deltaproteobacteria bacterium]|nr:hypothetical protein [Deltaproteobacteria bacterium]